MKDESSIRLRINDYLRKRRKKLTRLKGDIAETPQLMHLATLRPVNLIAISERVIQIKSEEVDWLEIIERTIKALASNKMWHEEAANIFVATLRAINSFDIELAIDFGYRYIEDVPDERAKKSMVNMLLHKGRKDEAVEILQSSQNAHWSIQKRLELMNTNQETASYESQYLNLIGRNNLEVDFRQAVLIYGDVNMNIIDGSSVWLASTAEVFTGMGVDVHVLLKSDITSGREYLLENLMENQEVRFIEPSQFGIRDSELTPKQAVELVEILDGIQGGYLSIILRGFELCTLAAGAKSLWKRVWAYLTDYYSIDSKHGRMLKPDADILIQDFSFVFERFLVQTEQMKDNLIQDFGIKEEMLTLFPPVIPDIPRRSEIRSPDGKDVFRIGYCGKIAPMWGVEELINASRKAIDDGYKVEVHIIGDKIHRNTISHPHFNDRMQRLLRRYPHVIWHGAQTRDAAIELMSTMDLAWCYRSPELETQTLELSTKLLENMSIGLPIILTRNEINENLLGSDYPLFIDRVEDIDKMMVSIIEGDDTSSINLDELASRAKGHSLDKVRTDVIGPLLASRDTLLDADVKRIVINGHDLKFIGEFESDLKRRGHIVRRDNWDWGQPMDEQKSRSLLRWAEIIHSEWGLANSVWYSNNVRDNQHHTIRVHLQEIGERANNFPSQINLRGVAEIIFVAENVRKVALDMFGWSEAATTVIPNFVDVGRHAGEKFECARKTVAIVGIVPQRKRVDRALDLLKLLRKEDSEWRLVIKGRLPRDIPFMHGPTREEELDYYDDEFKRIEEDPYLAEAVHFEGYSTTIASWYRNIGYILSPSDFESFHYSVADGVSSGAVPVIWPWEGADEVYPESWIVTDTTDAAQRILAHSRRNDTEETEEVNRAHISENFDCAVVFSRLRKSLALEELS